MIVIGVGWLGDDIDIVDLNIDVVVTLLFSCLIFMLILIPMVLPIPPC